MGAEPVTFTLGIMRPTDIPSLVPIMKSSRSFFIALAMLFSSLSFAGGSQSGLVAKIMVGYGNVPNTIYLNGSMNGRPSCASQPYWRIKDGPGSSEADAKHMMVIMGAQQMGVRITITGAGECTLWPDVEDVKAVKVEQ